MPPTSSESPQIAFALDFTKSPSLRQSIRRPGSRPPRPPARPRARMGRRSARGSRRWLRPPARPAPTAQAASRPQDERRPGSTRKANGPSRETDGWTDRLYKSHQVESEECKTSSGIKTLARARPQGPRRRRAAGSRPQDERQPESTRKANGPSHETDGWTDRLYRSRQTESEECKRSSKEGRGALRSGNRKLSRLVA